MFRHMSNFVKHPSKSVSINNERSGYTCISFILIFVLNLHFILRIVTGFCRPLSNLIASIPFSGISSGFLGKGTSSFMGSSWVSGTHSLLGTSMKYFTAHGHKIHLIGIAEHYHYDTYKFLLCVAGHTYSLMTSPQLPIFQGLTVSLLFRVF
jgi:uncharacterized membrane protein